MSKYLLSQDQGRVGLGIRSLIIKGKSLFTHKVSAKTSVKNHEKNYRLHDISCREVSTAHTGGEPH